MIQDPEAFILANTRVLRPPHCPELRLHLTDNAVELWNATEEELGRIGLAPPFWAFAWAGGQALARFVLDQPELVAGKRVVDLASGSGLVAIAAMRAGAASAIAVDIDPFAAAAAALNARLNSVEIETRTADVIGAPLEADILFVGDLFYDRAIAERLLAWLSELQLRGLAVRVGDPGRSYFPKDRFELLAEYRIPVTRALEDAEIKQTGVWRLQA